MNAKCINYQKDEQIDPLEIRINTVKEFLADIDRLGQDLIGVSRDFLMLKYELRAHWQAELNRLTAIKQ